MIWPHFIYEQNSFWIKKCLHLISVLKTTESVQLWLKICPTPRSGPSRHSLAATKELFTTKCGKIPYVCIAKVPRSPLSSQLCKWVLEQGCSHSQCEIPRCTGTSSRCLECGTSCRNHPLLQPAQGILQWVPRCCQLHRTVLSLPSNQGRHDPNWCFKKIKNYVCGHHLL